MAGDEGKFGFARRVDLEDAIACASDLSGVRLEGLMTMAPLVDPETARGWFRMLKSWFDEISDQVRDWASMHYLSMGMTNSYPVAIEEGANLVRIGTKIFGERRNSK